MKVRKLLAGLGVGALLVTAVQLTGIGSAAAHVARASSSASCDGYSGQWRMSVTITNDHGYGRATISGTGIAAFDGHQLNDGASTSNTINGLTDATHTVSGKLTWRDNYKANFSTTAYRPQGCVQQIPIPAAPVPTPPTCDAPGAATVPDDTSSIDWTLVGNIATANAKHGYQFSDGTTVKTFVEDVLPQLTGAQCAGDQPKPDVEHRDVADAPNCTDLTVTTEHQSRTREYVLDGSKWVPGPWSDWTTDSTTTADAPYGGECPFSIETNSEVSCGTASISLHNHSTWIYPVSYRIDGGEWQYGPVVDNRGAAPNDQTATKVFTFDEDSGTHTIEYLVNAGTESDLYKGLPVGESTTLTVESNCLPDVVHITDEPHATPPTCDTDGSLVVPANTDAIKWTQDHEGTGPGTYVVSAHTTIGYTFGGDIGRGPIDFTVTVLAAGTDLDCRTVVELVNPSATAGVCDTKTGVDSAPVVKVGDTEGVNYDVDGLTVTAHLLDGYKFGELGSGWVLNDDGSAQFVLTVTQPDCEKVVVTTTPPSKPKPSTTAPVAPKPHVTPVAHAPQRLASTGFQAGLFLWVALGLGIAGCGLVALAHRSGKRQQ